MASTGRVGNVLVALRCVEIRDKAISMAFQVLEKSCHSGFFCIESGSGKKLYIFVCVFGFKSVLQHGGPPFTRCWDFTVSLTTPSTSTLEWSPIPVLPFNVSASLYLRLFLSASLFCTDISVSLIQESPVFQLSVAKNRISLSSLQPILGPFFGKSCSGSLLKKRKH